MKRKKVLLADDVELFLELEKTFFQRKEIDLVIARTGQQALDLARSERPDLIFMDLFMPQMNGNDACRAIKQDPQLTTIPVVMVTQGGRDDDVRLCREACCDEILFKPINRHLFMETARRFLDFSDRQAPRVDTRLQVRYGVDCNRMVTDIALNLGEKGLFVVASELKPPGSRLFVELSLPGGDGEIACQGEVTWLNSPTSPARPMLPAGMGIAFVDLGDENRVRLHEFIKQECLSPSW